MASLVSHHAKGTPITRDPLVELVEGVVTVLSAVNALQPPITMRGFRDLSPHHLLATHGLQSWEPAAF